MSAEYHLYLDESGTFVAPRDGRELGLRVVAGVLLPGSRDEHDARAKALLDAHLEWWPYAWHATELGRPHRFAKALQRTPKGSLPLDVARLSAELRGRSLEEVRDDDLVLFDRVGRASRALLAACRTTVGGVVREVGDGGAVVIAAEYDTKPAASRYPTLLALTLGAVAWNLALRHLDGPPVRLTTIAESGAGSLTPAHLARLGASLRAPFERRGLAPPLTVCAPTFETADRHTPALVLADLVSHALGPKRASLVALSPGHARSLGRAQLAHTCEVAFGAREVIASGDALDDLLQALITGAAVGPVVEALNARLGALAPGELRAGVEESIRLGRRMMEVGW